MVKKEFMQACARGTSLSPTQMPDMTSLGSAPGCRFVMFEACQCVLTRSASCSDLSPRPHSGSPDIGCPDRCQQQVQKGAIEIARGPSSAKGLVPLNIV